LLKIERPLQKTPINPAINSSQWGRAISVLLVNANGTSCKSNVQFVCYTKCTWHRVPSRPVCVCMCVLPQGTQCDSVSYLKVITIDSLRTRSLSNKTARTAQRFQVPEWKEKAFTLQKHSDSLHFVQSPWLWFADCVNLWHYRDNLNWKMGLSNMTLIVVRTNELK